MTPSELNFELSSTDTFRVVLVLLKTNTKRRTINIVTKARKDFIYDSVKYVDDKANLSEA